MSQAAVPLEWSEAARIVGSAERDRFIEANVDLVRYVALRIAPRLPGSVELEDLVHDGILGLLDAVNKFRPDKGVQFRTYAERRVHGAILDGLRRKDWRPRALRRSRRELDAARLHLVSLHGREPTEDELSETMGLDLNELHQLQRDILAGRIVRLESHIEEAADGLLVAEAQHTVLERKQVAEALAVAIANLPERELKVLELYYHDGLNMNEAGAVLGVTESRVSQLHSQATARLRRALGERMSEGVATQG